MDLKSPSSLSDPRFGHGLKLRAWMRDSPITSYISSQDPQKKSPFNCLNPSIESIWSKVCAFTASSTPASRRKISNALPFGKLRFFELPERFARWAGCVILNMMFKILRRRELQDQSSLVCEISIMKYDCINSIVARATAGCFWFNSTDRSDTALLLRTGQNPVSEPLRCLPDRNPS